MKQPKIRRGHSLQRNDEGQLPSCGYFHLQSKTSPYSQCCLQKYFILHFHKQHSYMLAPAVCEFTQHLSDIHRQFQLGKLPSPFSSGTSIAISHPETVNTYVLHFNLAASSAFEAYQMAQDHAEFTKTSQVTFVKRKIHIAFYEVKENSLFLGKRG